MTASFIDRGAQFVRAMIVLSNQGFPWVGPATDPAPHNPGVPTSFRSLALASLPALAAWQARAVSPSLPPPWLPRDPLDARCRYGVDTDTGLVATPVDMFDDALRFRFSTTEGVLRSMAFYDLFTHASHSLTGELFTVTMRDKRRIPASEFRSRASSRVAGRQVGARPRRDAARQPLDRRRSGAVAGLRLGVVESGPGDRHAAQPERPAAGLRARHRRRARSPRASRPSSTWHRSRCWCGSCRRRPERGTRNRKAARAAALSSSGRPQAARPHCMLRRRIARPVSVRPASSMPTEPGSGTAEATPATPTSKPYQFSATGFVHEMLV